MRRWRLDSIAMTIGLTILLATGLGFTLQRLANVVLGHSGFLSWRNPRPFDARFYTFWLPARVVSLVEALDTIPGTEQEAVIAAAQRPRIRVQPLDTPLPGLTNSTVRVALVIRRRIDMLLTFHHLVIAAPRSQVLDKRAGFAGPGEQGMLVEVRLRDGHWLLFTTNVPAPLSDPAALEYSRTVFGGRLFLAGILILLLSLLVTRRLANPLSQLAVAVERLGASGDVFLVPPKGPRELRITIDAFNRMQERLRRFNDDRLQMLAAISHDLRTSLTRLKLRLEIGGMDEQKQRMIVELDAMSTMMASILSFARNDTKREARTLLDLDALVESVCDDFSDVGGAVTYTGTRGITISGRPAALRRAISNLIDNAVKYGGGAEVTLIAEAGQIVVAVEDRGPGIPRSEREKVFEAFYRIEDSRNPDTGGVGLGLSVARSIVREHGGDIILAARKGGGLSARFELPAWATSNEQPGSLGHQKPSCSVPSNYRSAVSLVAARLRGLLSTIPL